MKKSILFLFFLVTCNVFSQPSTNIEQINLLLKEVCNQITNNCGNNIYMEYDSPPNMGFFKNRLELFLTEKGKTIYDSSFANLYDLYFTIENTGVKYKNITKSGFFGDYFVEREVFLTGSYNIKNNGKIIFSTNVNKTVIDSVNYDDINKIENYSLPFTRSPLPSEPLAPSLLEPVIAISSAIITIVLFFIVRSK
ncbi:MAG: hypothetical protein V1773_15355 [bacterium]